MSVFKDFPGLKIWKKIQGLWETFIDLQVNKNSEEKHALIKEQTCTSITEKLNNWKMIWNKHILKNAETAYHPKRIIVLRYVGKPLINCTVNTLRIAWRLDTKQCRGYRHIAASEVVFHGLRNNSVGCVHQQPTANQSFTSCAWITIHTKVKHTGSAQKWNIHIWSTGCAKKWPNFFLSELHQISTKYDNFWHTDTDSQDDKIM